MPRLTQTRAAASLSALFMAFLLVLGLGLVKNGFFGAARPPVEVDAVSAGAALPTDPLAEFRREREQLRAMRKAQLSEIIYDGRTDADTAALARQELMRLDAWREAETTIEGVLRARGYPEAICTVHADSVNVLVHAETISREESAFICELVLREAGVRGGNVKIMPIP